MKLVAAGTRVFQENTVPKGTRIAGWALLAHAFEVAGPVRQPSCASAQHIRGSHREEGLWTVCDKRYWPGDGFADHLCAST